MKKLLFVGIGAALIFSLSASQGFSQVPALQNRIPQQIVIDGQYVPAAYVMAPGGGVEAGAVGVALQQRLAGAEHGQPQGLGEHAQGALAGVGDGGFAAEQEDGGTTTHRVTF